jgi:hypothetical protein
MVLEASYVGNLSRGLPIGNLNINQVPPELMGPGNAQARRPYPQFNNVTVLSPTIGFNNYHSGVLKVEKRYSHGLNVIGSYVWSRSIGNASNTSGDLGDDQIYQDLYNRRLTAVLTPSISCTGSPPAPYMTCLLAKGGDGYRREGSCRTSSAAGQSARSATSRAGACSP